MRRFTVIHELPCNVAELWSACLDDGLQRALYLEDLGFFGYEVLQHRAAPGEDVRIVKVSPRIELPDALARLLKGRFTYIETQRYDHGTRVVHSHAENGTFSERLAVSFQAHAEPLGARRCRSVVDYAIEARFLGIGGLIERTYEKNLRAGWAAHSAGLARHLERRHAA